MKIRNKTKVKYLIIPFFLLVSLIIVAQSPISQQEILRSLEAKNVSESQLNAFLLEKGLTESDLVNMSPEDILLLESDLDAFVLKQRVASADTLRPELPKVETIPAQNLPSSIEQKIKPASTENDSSPMRYGDQLFLNNNLKLFDQASGGQVPGQYVLNIGDNVQVSIFGKSKLEQVFTIGSDGAIVYKGDTRRLFLAGLSLNQAREKIKKVFRQYYVFENGELTVNVAGASIVSINIYGEVNTPGGYLISAVNSPVNAILAANGITKNGSYRNIKLIKDNGETFKIDLYTFLSNPEKLAGISLSNNDIIHIGTAGKLITLQGSVYRPMLYELNDSETLRDVLKYAGGLKPGADESSVQILRYAGSKRTVIDVPISGNRFNSFKLENGDVITVRENNGQLNNRVEVSGAVSNQGYFELSEGMKVSDLLKKITLNSNAKTDVALINRSLEDGSTKLLRVNVQGVLDNESSMDNFLLFPNDRLLIWSQSRFVEQSGNVQISGAVKSPGQYPLEYDQTQIEDLILYSGGLRRDASNIGMIYRKDPLNPNKVLYIQFDPFDATANTAGENNIVLSAFDSIVILQDVELAQSFQVEIQGEVNAPGKFQFGQEMTVQDLVVLAGGFNIAAQTDRIEINRTIIQNNEPTEIKVATLALNRSLKIDNDPKAGGYILQPFDKVYVRAVPEFELPRTVNISGEVRYPGSYVIEKEETLMSLIQRSGGLTKEAFEKGARLIRLEDGIGQVILNLDESQKSNKSKFNYILKNGDNIIIPKQEDIVTIKSQSLSKRIGKINDVGSVGNSISIAYFPGKSAKYYINNFGGGFGENSDRNGVFVEHPNGEISRTKSIGLLRSYPEVRKGSIIVIPEKPLVAKQEKEDDQVDWTKLLNDSVAQAMSILTLLLLVERI